ncbi:unnamed protein product [Clavelina lepadiformis]|uniref:N-acylneuraminate cytidylyltransferase n=1 Tax=Clavelina lepadiformis TaxID=159417 RepID=A0ABP0GZK3_CLALP
MNTPSSKRFHLAALILARGGSKGIPMKNLTDVAGKPLFVWVLQAAQDSKAFDRIWVSTDHKDIASVAKKYGAEIHIRSTEVSQDHSTSMESTLEFMSQHPEIDAIGLLQATTPCVQPGHLRTAGAMIRDHNYDSAFSVVRKHYFRWKERYSTDETTEPLNFDPRNRKRRQDWPGELCENGGFYFAKKHLLKEGVFQGGKMTYIEMGEEHSLDINSPFDLLLAEQVVKKLVAVS